MSVLFTDVMTVYNYIYDEKTEQESWKRTVVKGVQWSHNKDAVGVSNGVQTGKKVESITIDFQRRYGNETYIDPMRFKLLENKAGFWTLNAKDCKDVVVLGESEEDISNEYRIHQLKQDFQYCGTVTSVSDNRNRRFLQQIKVVAE